MQKKKDYQNKYQLEQLRSIKANSETLTFLKLMSYLNFDLYPGWDDQQPPLVDVTCLSKESTYNKLTIV